MYLWKIIKPLPYPVLIALMWAAQVGPQDAVSNLAKWAKFFGVENVPVWLSNRAADWWVFWIAAIVAIVYTGFLFYSWKKPNLSKDGEFISMKDAASKLYTEARRCKSLMAAGAEQLSGWAYGQTTSGTADDILDWMAGVIAGKKDIYGKRPPATAFEKISKGTLREHVFKEGATRLKHVLPNYPVEWTELAVRSADLDDVIADMQAQSGFDEHKL